MIVDPDAFELRLSWLRDQVDDPRAGIHGPDSLSWRLNRELIVFLAGGRAALLQTAHPYVAHAIIDHSRTRVDPLGRFKRTFDHVYAMIYGELEHAERSARRVYAIHRRVAGELPALGPAYPQGARYEATDARALLWVYATLIDSAVLALELCLRPLTRAEKDRYYRESWRFAALFGIPARILPADWSAFTSYCHGMWRSDRLVVGTAAMELRTFLFECPSRVRRPLFRWLEIMTAGLMPPELRAPYEFTYGPLEQLVHNTSIAGLRGLYPRLPARLRVHPAHVEARRRVAGRPGRDRFGRWLERVGVGLLDKGAPRGDGRAA